MVVVAPRLTEMASVIARVTVCPDLGYVEGLLTRPQIAAWSQWIAAVATVTICHVELSLAFVARLENFRPDPTTFRTDLRLTDVAFVSRRQPSNSLAFLTTRGHFGVRPVLQETDAVLRDTIQVRLTGIRLITGPQSNQILPPQLALISTWFLRFIYKQTHRKTRI